MPQGPSIAGFVEMGSMTGRLRSIDADQSLGAVIECTLAGRRTSNNRPVKVRSWHLLQSTCGQHSGRVERSPLTAPCVWLSMIAVSGSPRGCVLPHLKIERVWMRSSVRPSPQSSTPRRCCAAAGPSATPSTDTPSRAHKDRFEDLTNVTVRGGRRAWPDGSTEPPAPIRRPSAQPTLAGPVRAR